MLGSTWLYRSAAGLVGLWLALGCAPALNCPPRHHTHKEARCPACSPDRPCECPEVWVCREDPELAEEKRLQRLREQQEKERAQAQARDAAKQQALREAEDARKRAESEAYRLEQSPAPVHATFPPPEGTAAACAEPCSGNAVRWARFICSENGRALEVQNLECPASLPPGTRSCPEPWLTTSLCAPSAKQAPRPAVHCRAGPGYCCLEDGTVIRPCGPIGRPGCAKYTTQCGSAGFCRGCR